MTQDNEQQMLKYGNRGENQSSKTHQVNYNASKSSDCIKNTNFSSKSNINEEVHQSDHFTCLTEESNSLYDVLRAKKQYCGPKINTTSSIQRKLHVLKQKIDGDRMAEQDFPQGNRSPDIKQSCDKEIPCSLESNEKQIILNTSIDFNTVLRGVRDTKNNEQPRYDNFKQQISSQKRLELDLDNSRQKHEFDVFQDRLVYDKTQTGFNEREMILNEDLVSYKKPLYQSTQAYASKIEEKRNDFGFVFEKKTNDNYKYLSLAPKNRNEHFEYDKMNLRNSKYPDSIYFQQKKLISCFTTQEKHNERGYIASDELKHLEYIELHKNSQQKRHDFCNIYPNTQDFGKIQRQVEKPSFNTKQSLHSSSLSKSFSEDHQILEKKPTSVNQKADQTFYFPIDLSTRSNHDLVQISFGQSTRKIQTKYISGLIVAKSSLIEIQDVSLGPYYFIVLIQVDSLIFPVYFAGLNCSKFFRTLNPWDMILFKNYEVINDIFLNYPGRSPIKLKKSYIEEYQTKSNVYPRNAVNHDIQTTLWDHDCELNHYINTIPSKFKPHTLHDMIFYKNPKIILAKNAELHKITRNTCQTTSTKTKGYERSYIDREFFKKSSYNSILNYCKISSSSEKTSQTVGATPCLNNCQSQKNQSSLKSIDSANSDRKTEFTARNSTPTFILRKKSLLNALKTRYKFLRSIKCTSLPCSLYHCNNMFFNENVELKKVFSRLISLYDVGCSIVMKLADKGLLFEYVFCCFLMNFCVQLSANGHELKCIRDKNENSKIDIRAMMAECNFEEVNLSNKLGMNNYESKYYRFQRESSQYNSLKDLSSNSFSQDSIFHSPLSCRLAHLYTTQKNLFFKPFDAVKTDKSFLNLVNEINIHKIVLKILRIFGQKYNKANYFVNLKYNFNVVITMILRVFFTYEKPCLKIYKVSCKQMRCLRIHHSRKEEICDSKPLISGKGSSIFSKNVPRSNENLSDFNSPEIKPNSQLNVRNIHFLNDQERTSKNAENLRQRNSIPNKTIDNDAGTRKPPSFFLNSKKPSLFGPIKEYLSTFSHLTAISGKITFISGMKIERCEKTYLSHPCSISKYRLLKIKNNYHTYLLKINTEIKGKTGDLVRITNLYTVYCDDLSRLSVIYVSSLFTEVMILSAFRIGWDDFFGLACRTQQNIRNNHYLVENGVCDHEIPRSDNFYNGNNSSDDIIGDEMMNSDHSLLRNGQKMNKKDKSWNNSDYQGLNTYETQPYEINCKLTSGNEKTCNMSEMGSSLAENPLNRENTFLDTNDDFRKTVIFDHCNQRSNNAYKSLYHTTNTGIISDQEPNATKEKYLQRDSKKIQANYMSALNNYQYCPQNTVRNSYNQDLRLEINKLNIVHSQNKKRSDQGLSQAVNLCDNDSAIKKESAQNMLRNNDHLSRSNMNNHLPVGDIHGLDHSSSSKQNQNTAINSIKLYSNNFLLQESDARSKILDQRSNLNRSVNFEPVKVSKTSFSQHQMINLNNLNVSHFQSKENSSKRSLETKNSTETELKKLNLAKSWFFSELKSHMSIGNEKNIEKNLFKIGDSQRRTEISDQNVRISSLLHEKKDQIVKLDAEVSDSSKISDQKQKIDQKNDQRIGKNDKIIEENEKTLQENGKIIENSLKTMLENEKVIQENGKIKKERRHEGFFFRKKKINIPKFGRIERNTTKTIITLSSKKRKKRRKHSKTFAKSQKTTLKGDNYSLVSFKTKLLPAFIPISHSTYIIFNNQKHFVQIYRFIECSIKNFDELCDNLILNETKKVQLSGFLKCFKFDLVCAKHSCNYKRNRSDKSTNINCSSIQFFENYEDLNKFQTNDGLQNGFSVIPNINPAEKLPKNKTTKIHDDDKIRIGEGEYFIDIFICTNYFKQDIECICEKLAFLHEKNLGKRVTVFVEVFRSGYSNVEVYLENIQEYRSRFQL